MDRNMPNVKKKYSLYDQLIKLFADFLVPRNNNGYRIIQLLNLPKYIPHGDPGYLVINRKAIFSIYRYVTHTQVVVKTDLD